MFLFGDQPLERSKTLAKILKGRSTRASNSNMDSERHTYHSVWNSGKILDGDDDEELYSPEPVLQTSSTKWWTLFLRVIVAFLAFWGALNIAWKPLSLVYTRIMRHTTSRFPCYCGNSTSEALSLNCKYVAMSSAWLPPHCRDEQIESEFERLGPNPDGSWNYYADSNLTETLTPSQVAAMADNQHEKYHVSWEWHVVHCLFAWRKLHKMQHDSRLVMENIYNKDSHIMHCGQIILGSRFLDAKTAVFLFNAKQDAEDESKEMIQWQNLHKYAHGKHSDEEDD